MQILRIIWPAVSYVILLLAVMISVPGSSGASPRPESWKIPNLESHFASIDSLFNVGKLEKAQARINELVASYAENPIYAGPIQSRMGLILLRNGEPQRALEFLEKAVGLSPDDAVCHRNLASALMSLGKKGRGLSVYRVALQLEPGDPDLHREYGQSLTEMKIWGQAQKELEMSRVLCGDCPETVQSLANLFLVSGNYSAAVEPLQTLLKYTPESASIRNSLAISLANSGNNEVLLELLEQVPTDQLSSDEMILLAQTDLQTGLQDRALHWARQVQGHGEIKTISKVTETKIGLPAGILSNAHFWRTLSLNLLQGGNYSEALIAVDLAIVTEPGNVVARNNRAVTLQKLGRHEEAGLEWQKVLELDPSLESGK